MARFIIVLLLVLGSWGCDAGPEPGTRSDGGGIAVDSGAADMSDEDGDGISDSAEGRRGMRATDGDGTRDYADVDATWDSPKGGRETRNANGSGTQDDGDVDSNNDRITDAAEAAHAGITTPPRVAHGDGRPDLVAHHSAGNGILAEARRDGGLN